MDRLTAMLTVVALLNMTGASLRQATFVAILVTAMGVVGSTIRWRRRPGGELRWAATKPWLVALVFWVAVLLAVLLKT